MIHSKVDMIHKKMGVYKMEVLLQCFFLVQKIKMIITRDQALCMLFCVEFTPENVAHSEQKIADFGEIDICYEKDLKKPLLALISQIHKTSSTYRPYPVPSSENNADADNKKIAIGTSKEA